MSQENIEKPFSSKKLLTARDIQLDDDHPPAEALGYVNHIMKPYFDKGA